MFRKLLDKGFALTEKGKTLRGFRTLVQALDTFIYEPKEVTTSGPQIRDSVDQKRWMILVVFALFPCTLMAIWNTGVQKFVYSSGDGALMSRFITASSSLSSYFAFCFQKSHLFPILGEGLLAFLPILLISYTVGGLVEFLFAALRGHEISEGFLVSGILFALILPPTIPYWLVALGVATGIILSKELFGGSGMNILNPALTCRTLLFFAYPTRMSGDVWVGTNPLKIKESLVAMNQGLSPLDGFTQVSPLGIFNISTEIKRIHIETIATQFADQLPLLPVIKAYFLKWSSKIEPGLLLDKLSPGRLQEFVTSPLESGGLGLDPELFTNATCFAQLKFGQGLYSSGNFFFGNKLGSMGETSTLACLLGALFLIYLGIASWRTMVAMGVGGFICALLFQYGASHFGLDYGAWNPAKFDLAPLTHLIMGGFAFGLVFMATDPVSSPTMSLAKWVYGLLIGMLVIVIRLINPAYPEGVMLAILFGNVFAPLFDRFALKRLRRSRLKDARKIV